MNSSPRRILPFRLTVALVPFASVILVSICTSSFAGTIVDLTVSGNSGVINGAIFEQVVVGSTGTGVIDAFSQQSPPGSGITSRAYNTTANPVLNNAAPDNFNHSVTLGQISIVERSGKLYREFFLDINESAGGGNNFLSLDEIQIFAGGTANSSVSTFTGLILDHDGTLLYRMDSGDDNWVALDSSLGTGSGSGDMILLVPQTLFRGFTSTEVVTLYSEFGLQGEDPAGFTGDFGSSSGFEEWALRDPAVFAVAVPEPFSTAFLATAIFGLAGVHRRRS
jgi:hypothetical protein